jgi:hypothetical protein
VDCTTSTRPVPGRGRVDGKTGLPLSVLVDGLRFSSSWRETPRAVVQVSKHEVELRDNLPLDAGRRLERRRVAEAIDAFWRYSCASVYATELQVAVSLKPLGQLIES